MATLQVIEHTASTITFGTQWSSNLTNGVKLLLHITTPFSLSYSSTTTGRIRYYVPDEALAAFKAAWSSSFVIKGLSEYDGRIYG